jgi:flagellar hook protein FlgE
MLTSFYSALTGLNTNGSTINVIGNNLANINSTAYKSSRASFAELVASGSETASNGNPIQVGLGATSTSVSPLFNQGSIQTTGRSTDVAISGSGFFVVSTGGAVGYSRAGSFSFSKDGELMSPEGFKVMGYAAQAGVINRNLGLVPIIIPKGSAQPPEATTEMGISANLDARTATGDSFMSAVQVYDSLGAPHTVGLTFTKTGNGAWSWTATVPAADTGGAATAAPTQIGAGTLTFDSAGILTAPATNPILAIAGLANGAANMNITLDVLDSGGLPRLTSFAADSGVSASGQNGYPASLLREIAFGSDGTITGVYEDGQVQPLAQVALANFPNPEGLIKFRGSTFVASAASGQPSVGTPGSGGRGSITGGALEQSNVDIAQEFTSMIIAQRGYQANSRVISVTDELYQDAINLKR